MKKISFILAWISLYGSFTAYSEFPSGGNTLPQSTSSSVQINMFESENHKLIFDLDAKTYI